MAKPVSLSGFALTSEQLGIANIMPHCGYVKWELQLPQKPLSSSECPPSPSSVLASI